MIVKQLWRTMMSTALKVMAVITLFHMCPIVTWSQTAITDTVNFPYYTLADDMSSTLMLNNNGITTLSVTVTAYSQHGHGRMLGVVPVGTNSPAFLNLTNLLNDADSDFQWGNISCTYTGSPMQLTGQVTVLASNHHISFQSRMAMDQEHTKLDGVVWLPDFGASGIVALTNVANDPITVDVTSGHTKQHVKLIARETRVLKLSEIDPRRATNSFLITLSHTGRPGDLIATGAVFNMARGYSSDIAFMDSGTNVSNKLAGAHFFSGTPDSHLDFPTETRFRSTVVVANRSMLLTQTNISIDYTVNKIPGYLTLPALLLEPGAVTAIDLTDKLAAIGITDVDNAGIDINYNGAPGSVLASLTSMDQSGAHSFYTPIKDPEAGMFRSGGSHPWRLDNDNNTLVHLKNVTAKQVYGMVLLRFDTGGQYTLPRVSLAPHETVSLDLSRIVTERKKDLDGNEPPSSQTGKVLWFEEDGYSLIGRVDIFNVRQGVGGSFSCFYPCTCNPATFSPNTSDTFTVPASFSMSIGGSAAIATDQKRYNCNNSFLGTFDITASSTYTSGNTGVFTVSGASLFGVAAGRTAATSHSFRNTDSPPACPVQAPIAPAPSVTVKPWVQVSSVSVSPSTIHTTNSPKDTTITVQLANSGDLTSVPGATATITVSTYSSNPAGKSITYNPQTQTKTLVGGTPTVFTFTGSSQINNAATFQVQGVVTAVNPLTGIDVKAPMPAGQDRTPLVVADP